MQKVTIKSTFSPNLGGIQDLQGMPILQTGKDVQNRILNFFYKAFGRQRNMLNFIGKDPKEVKKFEKDLLKMVYGKDAKYIDVDNISLVGKTINNMLLSNTIKVF